MSRILEILHHNVDSLQKYDVERLALFGSYARNEQHEESDIDVLVVFEEGKVTFRNFMGLKQYLEDLLGCKVDLVTERAIRKELLPSILKEAIDVKGL